MAPLGSTHSDSSLRKKVCVRHRADRAGARMRSVHVPPVGGAARQRRDRGTGTTGSSSHNPHTAVPDMEARMKRFGQLELEYVMKVMDSGSLCSRDGGFTTELEERFAEWVKADHAVAMNSAMSVLHASVAALGVGPGDEVICDPVVHFGGAAVMYHNGVPVFCDIDQDSHTMDPASLESCITDRTRAIICTLMWGNPCDYDGILRVAEKHGLPVIEDVAHAQGASYRGQAVGTIGTIGSFSFQEGKHLTSVMSVK